MFTRILMLFIPIALCIEWFLPDTPPVLRFLLALVALIPSSLAIEENTEGVAHHAGETIGGFLNSTFGNLPELFIGVATLRLGMYELLKAQIIGGIVVNILFVLGLAMLIGGMKRPFQAFNTVSARNFATLLLIATMSLLIPSTYISRHEGENTESVVALSLTIAIALTVVYACYLYFSMGTHRKLIESDAGTVESQTTEKPKPLWMVVGLLLFFSLCAVLLSDMLIGTIEPAAAALNVNELFMGLIVLGIIGNISGLVTAISAARKDRMDLAFSVGIGSSVQQILFVVPAVVFLSYIFGPQPMNLAFDIGISVMLLLSVIVMGALIGDGQSHWFKGLQLLGLFGIIIAAILFLTS